MNKPKLTRRLGAFLGLGFIVFGLVETAVAIINAGNIAFFWFPALCGGGTLILLGIFQVRRRWLSASLVVAGAFLGSLATFWTILVPLLSFVLIYLVVTRGRAELLESPALAG